MERADRAERGAVCEELLSLRESYERRSEKIKKKKMSLKGKGEGEYHQQECRAGQLPAGQQHSSLPWKGLLLLQGLSGPAHRLAA
jgi:hypothetical protein